MHPRMTIALTEHTENDPEGEGDGLDVLLVARAHEESFEWDPGWKGEFLKGLRLQPNITAAARMAGVTPQAAYYQRDHDPLFRMVWLDAIQQSVDLLAGVQHRLGTTGVETSETRTTVKRALDPVSKQLVVVEETVVTVVGRMISPASGRWLLQVHAPEQYSPPPSRRELTGRGGGPIEVVEVYRPVDPDRAIEIARLLVEQDDQRRLEEAQTVEGEADEV